MRAPTEWKRKALRRLFDEEGSVGFQPSKYHRWISLRSYSKNVREQVVTLLSEFGINSHNYDKGRIVVITGKKNLERFANEMNFSPGVKVVRGKYWVGHEKRNVLRMALESYRQEHRRWIDSEIQKLVELRERGKSLNDIAKILNRSYGSVRNKWYKVGSCTKSI
jgi:hypothetical protein